MHETTYDAQGRVLSEESPEGKVHYEYNDLGQRKRTYTTDSTGDVDNDFTYTYDAFGRLETVSVWERNGVTVDVRSSDGILGEGTAGADAVELIETLYKAGAKEVIAIEIDQDPDVGENTGKLIVTLDDNASHRKNVLKICNRLSADLGLGSERDVGQPYLLVMLD